MNNILPTMTFNKFILDFPSNLFEQLSKLNLKILKMEEKEQIW